MARKKAQQSTLSYSNVEAALMRVFDVDDGDLLSFRGRIRHLRTLNVPRNMPRPGSGRTIQLTPTQVLELAVALCLEEYGTTPRWAADAGPDIATAVKLMRTGPYANDDFYAVFYRGSVPPLEPMAELGMNYVLVPGFDQLQARLKDRFDRGEDGCVVLNVSNLTRKVEQALREKGVKEDVS